VLAPSVAARPSQACGRSQVDGQGSFGGAELLHISGDFEWDRGKADSNWRKHGVTFDHAVLAIGDPGAIEWIDDGGDYGEERSSLLGICGDIVLYVAYTIRGKRKRIITARRATRREQDNYFRKTAP